MTVDARTQTSSELLALVLEDIAHLRKLREGQPLLIGVCGAQGSGKSTLCAALEQALSQDLRLNVAVLSIDDLYLPAAERAGLAQRVHPLLRTRGVPGTHEVALGIDVIERLMNAAADERIALPRFDKLADDRLPPSAWPRFKGRADVVLLEGWCVGARPQPASELATPINTLERAEDPDGRWRQYVNTQLAGTYQALFGLMDRLVMLRAPGFEVVFEWRRQQEHSLAREMVADEAGRRRVMSDAELARFIMHYERLTRFILDEMPHRADTVVSLDAARRVLGVARAKPSIS